MTLLVYGADEVTLSIKDGDERVKLANRNVLHVNQPLGSETSTGGNIQNIEITILCEYGQQKVQNGCQIDAIAINFAIISAM